uniref:Uncharacterized protein n=1 Tax=Nelumbo nucifera TaxID=4432 RepID=A0A822Z9H3_NELNU|nr:TPA_asm: hypothetical protein HUJ06_014714 [Nelumbo nucifera]
MHQKLLLVEHPFLLDLKIEEVEDVKASQTRELLQRVNESSVKGRPKIERKCKLSSIVFLMMISVNTALRL